MHAWNQEFVANSPEGKRYEAVADDIERALAFMKACGIDLHDDGSLQGVDFYTSHEALILNYEEALTRRDSLTGDWYDTSAHMLWIGERTRQVDGAHVEFFSGVHNPIGVKLGPTATPDEAIELAERLNPERIPGRLTFVARMGAGRVQGTLPALLRGIADAGHPVVWACDPMHGNTIKSSNGFKTRKFEDILSEVKSFFQIHHEIGSIAGGVHFELTGQDVTECLGGNQQISELNLSDRYHTHCDPRLNSSQSIEMAFTIAHELANSIQK